LKILIINGPNLNLLGKREPSVYGDKSFEEFLEQVKHQFSTLEIHYFQSNIEGELIDQLHQTENADYQGVVLNAGGYSHTSVALADAVAAITTPVIGVHISNIYAREQERHTELLAQYCKGGIFGLGLQGYVSAIQSLISL
jgi:3-dehydroquinate dehydratase-2|tara:strand:+ start:4404 stop:4826 length:423 start_codon:yes stop_codon:yes gene_type:complete